ncbi:MAG: DUF6473 family protein [Crocosphaera sp.]|nr:DUF6473 family protein [Crocosphaera sp.]
MNQQARRRHGGKYNDPEIVDYQYFPLEDTGLRFRGPQPEKLEKNQYFVCLGAAQTLGRFCQKPYPKILGDKLKFPSLNLGVGGAGPYYFLKTKELFPYINKSRFVIVQVMSGRSESNCLFDSGGLGYLTRRTDQVCIGADTAYQELLDQKDRKYLKEIIRETRQNWIDNFQILMEKITVPKILFWFSERSTFYRESYTNVHTLMGKYPQFVNTRMVKSIKKNANEYVECISTRGKPNLHISQFTHQPTWIKTFKNRQDLIKSYGEQHLFNTYYPSPEMHVDAALSLENICQKYLI